MLKLLLENTTTVTPSLPFRWCVEPTLLARLREGGAYPHVLLVAVHGKREVLRKLVPLENMLEYLHFNNPGPHTVYGLVVCAYSETPRAKQDLYRYYLETDAYGRYLTRLVSDDDWDENKGTFRVSCCCFRLFEDPVVVTIEVARKFFADEPPKWLKAWVNLWFWRAPRDECQFRKRLILAFTIQPLGVAWWLAFTTIARSLVALWHLVLFGRRGINFRAIVHPFRSGWEDVGYEVGTSIFRCDKEGKKRPWYVPLFTPVVPVTAFLLQCLAIQLAQTSKWEWLSWVPELSLIQSAVLALLVPVALGVGGFAGLAMGYILCSVASGLGWLMEWAYKHFTMRAFDWLYARLGPWLSGLVAQVMKFEERQKAKRPVVDRAQLEFLLKYEPLLCRPEPTGLRIRVEELPKDRRTFHLRYEELKAKVCRRFAL